MFDEDIPVFIQPKKPEPAIKRKQWEMDKVEQMLRQGKRIKEIASELDRNPSTIYRWLWGGRKAKTRLAK